MRAHRMAVFGCTALLAVGAAACGAARVTTAATVPAGRSTPAAAAGNADTVILGTTDKVVGAGPGRGVRPRLPAADRQHVPEPAVGSGGREQARAGRRRELRLHGSEDVRLQAQAGPEVLERRPADVRGRQVLARSHAQDRGPERSVHAAGLAGLGRGDRSDDRHDEAQEGRRHVALHPHPQRRGDRARTRSTRPTRSSPTTRRSARARTSSTSTRRTSRPCSRPTRTTRAPNKAQTPNFIVQYFEQASALKLAIEQGDVDVAYRASPRPTSRRCKAESDKGVKVVDGAGTEIRYIVFNVKKKPVGQRRRPQGRSRRSSTATRSRPTSTRTRSRRCTRRFRPRSRAPRSPSRTPSAIRTRPRPRPILDEAGVKTPVDARRLVHADPLRAGRGRSLERDQASARGDRPVQGQPRLDRVGPVQGRGVRQGHVLLLRHGLVPGLPGRRQLPRAVHA